MQTQFHFQSATHLVWLLALGGVVGTALVCIALLYRYERRLVATTTGVVLLALRCAALGAVFFMLLEPVLSWTESEERKGTIVLAVDVSDSMSTADRHASRAEKLRVARGIGLIGNDRTQARLDRWQAALDAGQEPDYVDPGETSDPDKRVRLTETRKRLLENALTEVESLPRSEIVRRLLARSKLVDELSQRAPVEIVAFAGKPFPLTRDQLDEALAARHDAVQPDASDLTLPAGVKPAVEGAGVAGIVMFTDGRDNAGRDPSVYGMRIGERRPPVVPVLVGSVRRPKDLSFLSLDFPGTAFKDDKPVLRGTLNSSGFEGEPIAVVLSREGAPPVEITVTSQANTAAFELPLPVAGPGRYVFTVETPPRDGETRKDNNQRSFAVTIVDDKVRVRLFDGEARWEFRYVHNALFRDQRVKLDTVVYRQPYLGLLPVPYYPERVSWPADPTDLARSPLAETDLLIVGDVSDGDFPEAAWQSIDRFVAEGGGTLVLSAGKRFLPLASRSETLQKLLPVTGLGIADFRGESAKRPPAQRGFRLKLTPEAEAEPMFQFSTDPVQNRGIWNSLPGHVWGLVGTAKPGATVFAYGYEPGQQVDIETERRRAVIVQQHYGLGQVLWIGVDSTWRWRHRAGDLYHHRFWGQLGRWAANNKVAAGNEHVKFGPDKPDIDRGETAVFRARFTLAFLRRFPDLKAQVVVKRVDAHDASAAAAIVPLEPHAGRPGLYEGRLPGLAAGEYQARLSVSNAQLGDRDITTTLFVQEPRTLELSDLTANPELLALIAQRSGGRLIKPDEVSSIPDLLVPRTREQSLARDILVWDHWLMLAVCCAILAVEWFVRKTNGLP